MASDVNKENTARPSDSSDQQIDPNDDFGYYFFPQRQDQNVRKEATLLQRYLSNPFSLSGAKTHEMCKINIVKCIRNDPSVKLMVRAMNAHGCAVGNRHFTCEPCRLKVSGGLDPVNNQIVICENTTRNLGGTCSVMAHELLHAFDKCRTHFDYKNPEHVACTEIRAANLFHCSVMGAIVTGSISPFKIKEQHQKCVKDKALLSLMMARKVSKEEGMSVIAKVFPKCYNDLEPLGRRLRKGTRDDIRALQDAELFGYFDPLPHNDNFEKETL